MAHPFEDFLVSKITNVALTREGAADLAALSMRANWVGGRTYLLPDALMFAANGPNRVANRAILRSNSPLMNFGIRLGDISTIQVRSWFGIKTIEVRLTTADTVLGIRCRGAAQFAAQILAQVDAQSDEDSRSRASG